MASTGLIDEHSLFVNVSKYVGYDELCRGLIVLGIVVNHDAIARWIGTNAQIVRIDKRCDEWGPEGRSS